MSDFCVLKAVLGHENGTCIEQKCIEMVSGALLALFDAFPGCSGLFLALLDRCERREIGKMPIVIGKKIGKISDFFRF